MKTKLLKQYVIPQKLFQQFMMKDFSGSVIYYPKEIYIQSEYYTQKTSPMLKKNPCEPLIPNP